MSSHTKRIWLGLVNYANSAANGIDINGLRQTLAACAPWYAVKNWLGFGSLSVFDVAFEDAVKYQGSIRTLLRCFCRGKRTDGKVTFDAFGFLREHMQHIKWDFAEVSVIEELKEYYSSEELEHFQEESRRYWAGFQKGDSPLGICTPTKEYYDLADPICDFLLTEYQKYRQREYSRKDKKLPPPVPIFICPVCDNLVLAERVGRRKYCANCSDKARARSYLEKASPEENKDYQWLYRLQHYDPGTRRARLRQQKVQKRLAEIRARQKESHRCQRLIHEMRLHVAPTK